MQNIRQYLGRANWNITVRDVLDPSVLSLLASNAALIIWALIERWPLPFVLCVYWAQSVIIGIFWFFTILTYGRIYRGSQDDQGYREYTPLGPIQRFGVAVFFLFHYGLFHALYIFWMLEEFLQPALNRIRAARDEIQNAPSDFPFWTLLIFAGIFFFSRLATFLREKKQHAQKQANLAQLTYCPYVRIVPMHAAMVFASSLEKGNITPQSALLFFLLLKTAADVFMHIVQKKGFADDIEGTRIDDSGPRVTGTLDGPALVMPDGRIIPLTDRPDIVEKLQRIKELPSEVRLEVCRKLLRLDDPPPKQTPQMKCRCEKTDFIEGEAAQEYADGHLEWLETAESGSSRYICPDTKKTWVMVAGVLKAEHPEADKVLCRCREIERLQGPDAHHYAKEHLKAVETDGGWRTTYICPYTDKRWLLDFTKITDVDQYKYARLRPMALKENDPGRTCIQDG